jgi:hypothetical protein
MTNAGSGRYFSFTTSDADWPIAGLELRLLLAEAFSDAGANVDTTLDPHEVDWVFNAVYETQKFSVVLVIMRYTPCNWFVYIEGDALAGSAATETRRWAHPIIENTIRRRTGCSSFRWHDSSDTLNELC